MEQARIGHTWYRDTFLTRFITDGTLENVFSGDGSTMGSVEPGFWNFNLNRAARGHCTDVIKHPSYRDKGGGHNDANGTSASGRINKFSDWNSEIYINQAPGSGLNRGFASVGSWICDGYHWFGNLRFSSCCRDSGKDKSGSSCVVGHRTGIMQSCLQFGCGVDGVGGPHHLSGSYTTTCDCLNRATVKYAGKHIASASHVGDPLNSSNFMYLATLLTTDITVSSVTVVEETPLTSNTITLTAAYTGTKGAIYTSPSYTKYTGCQTYYFTLKYGSTTERYPETGYFYTYGMSCDTDWMAEKQTLQCTSGVCCDTTTGIFKPRTTVCNATLNYNCTGRHADCIKESRGFPVAATVALSVIGALLLVGIVVLVVVLLLRKRGSTRSTVELEKGTSAPKPKATVPAAAPASAAASSASQPAKPSYMQKKPPATPPAPAPRSHPKPKPSSAPPPPVPRSRPAPRPPPRG